MKRLVLAAALSLVGCGGLLPGIDAGADAGNNPTDGGSDGGFMCNPTESQPALCAYGEYCHSSRQCRDAQKGTCMNFSAMHSTTSWNFTTSTGPVIWDGVDETVDDATKCPVTATAFTVTLKAYTTTTFPANKSGLMGTFHVSTTGMETELPMLLEQMNYTLSSDMKNATMKFTLCGSSTMSVLAGFYFTGGNPFCMTVTHN